ncbi:proton-conducting transporter transmembrane domain-containing protein [Chitinophaga alhagiae]|uniref:proton-conducting transporter transmembrane domain-containing protein n=1 Tax=Chitinophaga alhagiae TaxID=2203219 RepID=UPI000E5C2865|nr:proton-conducting transporter membrane subunit [Chitinophaga alhagiae]
MTDNYIILPIIAHLAIAVLLIFFWRKVQIQRYISVLGSLLVLGLSIGLFIKTWRTGYLTMQAGNWQAPFGITFVSDVFSSTMVLLAGMAGLAVCIFSSVGISRHRIQYGYFPIFHFLLLGLNGAFLTGDIFNLYVWFEVIIISSFVLMTLGGKKPQIEGGIKYVTLNLLASVMFLTAVAILYGLTGSLNMADLSLKMAEIDNRGLVNVTGLLFFLGFGIKSAVFPLYFWLPSSYHTPPSAIAAIFGGLLTKVGVYALLRVFTLIFIPDEFTSTMLMAVATLTLLTGAFGAVIKRNMRMMFSYLIVCHIGYLIGGLGMYTQAALAGVIFYLIHDIIVKTNLFLVSGIIYKIRGTMNMDKLGGLYADYPKLSFLMAIVFFSLVGIPPLSGFWPKIYLFQEGLATPNAWYLVVAMIIASFVTLYVIAKMWADVFWKDRPAEEAATEDDFAPMKRYHRAVLIIPVVMLAIASLYIGFCAEHIATLSQRIAADLKDTAPYIKAVLGREIIKP